MNTQKVNDDFQINFSFEEMHALINLLIAINETEINDSEFLYKFKAEISDLWHKELSEIF